MYEIKSVSLHQHLLIKILLVEPETAVTHRIQRVLTDRVQTIDTAIAVDEALQQITQNAYDLIVVDVSQQKLDGIGLCRQIRSQGWPVPILALTRRRGTDKTWMALEAGATDCMAYPFSVEEFVWRAQTLMPQNAKCYEDKEDKFYEDNSAFLNEISLACSYQLSPEEIIQIVGAKLGEHLQITGCSVCEIDETYDQMIFHVRRWHRAGTPELPDRLCLSEHINSEFLEKIRIGEPIVNHNVHTNSIAKAAANQSVGVESFISVPFFREGKGQCLFSIHNDRPRIWREDEIKLVIEVAHHTLPRIDRAQAEEQVRKTLRDMERLHHLSTQLATEGDLEVFYEKILNTAIALMHSNMGGLQILDQEQNELKLHTFQGFHPAIATFWDRVKLGGGSICSLAWERRERIIVPDVETCDFLAGTRDLEFYRISEIRSGQCTPLISRSGQVLGMFSTYWRIPYEPTAHELQFLDLLARQAADLIEQQEAELALQNHQATLRLALAGAKAGTWDWDLATGRFILSPEAYALQGYDREEKVLLYDQWYNTRLHPDDRLWVDSFLKDILAQPKEDFQLEYRILHPQNGVCWLLSIGRLIFDDRGEPRGMSGMNLDISHRKQAELDLQQQIRQEYLLADMAQDIRHSLDLQDVLSRTVDRVRDVLHCDRAVIFRFQPDWSGEVIMESVDAECQPILGMVIVDPCFKEHRKRFLAAYQQGKISSVADLHTEDLENCYFNLLRSLQIRASLVVPILQDEHIWGLLAAHQCREPRHWQTTQVNLLQRLATQVGIAIQQAELYQELQVELTERQLAEQKIREQAALLDVTSNAVFVQDLDNRVIYWNRGAERLYGWSAAEAIGQVAHDFLQGQYSLPMTTILQQITQIGEWQSEVHKITKTGASVIVAARWTLMRDATGQPQSILVVDTDITEKKQLEAQFYHAQRLESIGTLASGIAHDLNNVFTPILAGSQLLQLQLQSEISSRYLELLNLIEQSAKRGSSLIKQVLTFSRGTEDDRITLSVKPIIEEVVNVLESSLPSSIRIEITLPEVFPWLIFANAIHIHQILMNLCINARDAMENGGLLSIDLDHYWIDQSNLNTLAPIHFTADPGEYVRLTVADTGTGIPPEVRDRIFEPFFTTKPLDKGTGLGLSSVFGIVKNYGGFIHIRTEVGEGTSFQVYLPVVATELANIMPPPSSSILPVLPTSEQPHSILLIDDDEFQQMTLEAILEHYNYTVITTPNGFQGLELYRQHQADILAAIVDIMMPTVNGLDLIPQLKQLNPELTIVAMSGLPNHREGAIAAGATTFLNKPYTPDTILRAIRQIQG